MNIQPVMENADASLPERREVWSAEGASAGPEKIGDFTNC
jgi:hypothetical protein